MTGPLAPVYSIGDYVEGHKGNDFGDVIAHEAGYVSTIRARSVRKDDEDYFAYLLDGGDFWFEEHELQPARIECVQDAVNHPKHYTTHPSGVECITITEHMNFCLGNAVKYIWRADSKGNALEDLQKAEFYVKREIERRRKGI